MVIDIGGGTTKLGLVQNGELVATAAVHLGGRLMVVDEKNMLTRLDPAGAYLAKQAGFNWKLGDQVTRQELATVAHWMADALVRVLSQTFSSEDLSNLFLKPASSFPAQASFAESPRTKAISPLPSCSKFKFSTDALVT